MVIGVGISQIIHSPQPISVSKPNSRYSAKARLQKRAIENIRVKGLLTQCFEKNKIVKNDNGIAHMKHSQEWYSTFPSINPE